MLVRPVKLGDENMNADHENLMNEDFSGRHVPERFCVPSHCNLEDSDTDDEAQTCKKQPHKQKPLSSQPAQLVKLSDIQNCGAGSPWHESISLTASPSLSLTAQDNQNRAILDDCSNTLLKRSQSCGVERETTSPTRWYANTWQKRQLSTPCYKSEVSSVVESVHGTEDGYEGDSSNSEEECDWLLDLEVHCPMMPSFWLIMALHNEAVTIYFHCRSPPQEVGESESYLAVQNSIVVCIKDLCKLVNQTLLLQSLHDYRMCEPLLEPESSEDSWQVVVAMSLDHNYTRLKSVDVGGVTNIEITKDMVISVAGARQKWQSYLEANRRGKENAQKNSERKSFTEEIDELKAKKQRLQADVDTLIKTADRLSEQAETTGNLTFVSKSNSFKRPAREKTAALADINKQLSDRLRSFGERETVASPAESSTPCVTPQPLGIKPEDTVTLKVHGISEAGPEIKEELVQVLQNRMDDAVLEVLSVMLARNPMCKLTPDDVHFIQKPFHAPDSIIQDYSQPETSSKRVSEKDIFVYNQSTTSGNKGIACIALAVVDTQGHTIQHSNYAKPFITAYKKELKPDDFAALTSTIINKSDCAFKELSSQAVMEFRIWKQGRVNIESLTQKLGAAVRHALWDLLMEYRLLTTPIPEIQFFPSSEPTTPNKGAKAWGSKQQVLSRVSPQPLLIFISMLFASVDA
uniref:(California timema) hypothetical protein n=1 Tax=Timema californicum TaxID=61474 RepID=A0A7R9IX32_TIMCA|nr:unnamed protein product [Timema californicum]